jgi:uncharacterized protein (UPF0332 family)
MNPRKFLALARRLAAGTEEEDWRTAVSRAYYAAFHVACDLMTGLGFTVPNAEQAHGYLWLRLQNCGHPPTINAGVDLKDLRRSRNRADYYMRKGVSAGDARSEIVRAESILQALDSAAVAPVRSQITTAMKDYEKNVLRDATWHP